MFPGGTVDPEDRVHGFWQTYVDMDSKSISRRLGGDLTVDEVKELLVELEGYI